MRPRTYRRSSFEARRCNAPRIDHVLTIVRFCSRARSTSSTVKSRRRAHRAIRAIAVTWAWTPHTSRTTFGRWLLGARRSRWCRCKRNAAIWASVKDILSVRSVTSLERENCAHGPKGLGYSVSDAREDERARNQIPIWYETPFPSRCDAPSGAGPPLVRPRCDDLRRDEEPRTAGDGPVARGPRGRAAPQAGPRNRHRDGPVRRSAPEEWDPRGRGRHLATRGRIWPRERPSRRRLRGRRAPSIRPTLFRCRHDEPRASSGCKLARGVRGNRARHAGGVLHGDRAIAAGRFNPARLRRPPARSRVRISSSGDPRTRSSQPRETGYGDSGGSVPRDGARRHPPEGVCGTRVLESVGRPGADSPGSDSAPAAAMGRQGLFPILRPRGHVLADRSDSGP